MSRVPADVSRLERLGGGRQADIYALDGHRVLRRYRDGTDTAHEAMTMAYLAAHGYPVPVVHHSAGPDLVLERLDGRTMVQDWRAGALDVETAARLLAGLHRDLHAVPPPDGAGPDAAILHLDLHPENVLMTGRGPVVIDWSNTALGPPGYDLAVSALILAEVAIGPREGLGAPTREFLRRFLGLVDPVPAAMLARAVDQRAGDPTLDEAERADLVTAANLVTALAPVS
jgi:aminoglycoside phosphotransferase (APT) family kinase protein